MTVEEAQQIEAAFRAASSQVDELRPRRNEAIRELIAAGLTYAQIGEALGLSLQRIGQIAGQVKATGASSTRRG